MNHADFRAALWATTPEGYPALFALAPWHRHDSVRDDALLQWYEDGDGELPGGLPIGWVKILDWPRRLAVADDENKPRGGGERTQFLRMALSRVSKVD